MATVQLKLHLWYGLIPDCPTGNLQATKRLNWSPWAPICCSGLNSKHNFQPPSSLLQLSCSAPTLGGGTVNGGTWGETKTTPYVVP